MKLLVEPSLGAVYTRAWVVELLLDLAGYAAPRNLVDARAVEPSAGGGLSVADGDAPARFVPCATPALARLLEFLPCRPCLQLALPAADSSLTTIEGPLAQLLARLEVLT